MKKILITDDQTEVRALVEVTLRSGNYEVLHASSGKEALAITASEKPDLIIMDVMMPGEIDGLEATRQIKADPEMQQCVILLLTGRAQDKDREAGLSAGADDYFYKPFSPLELIRKIEDMIG